MLVVGLDFTTAVLDGGLVLIRVCQSSHGRVNPESSPQNLLSRKRLGHFNKAFGTVFCWHVWGLALALKTTSECQEARNTWTSSKKWNSVRVVCLVTPLWDPLWPTGPR